MRRRRPHARGSEARAGPVGGREVEGYAGDGHVDAIEIPGVPAAQEAERARVRVLHLGAVEGAGGKRVVAHFIIDSNTGLKS